MVTALVTHPLSLPNLSRLHQQLSYGKLPALLGKCHEGDLFSAGLGLCMYNDANTYAASQHTSCTDHANASGWASIFNVNCCAVGYSVVNSWTITGPTSIVAGTRHSGGANYLLADGHVKWLVGTQVSTGASAGQNTNGTPNCAASVNSLGNYAVTFSVN